MKFILVSDDVFDHFQGLVFVRKLIGLSWLVHWIHKLSRGRVFFHKLLVFVCLFFRLKRILALRFKLRLLGRHLSLCRLHYLSSDHYWRLINILSKSGRPFDRRQLNVFYTLCNWCHCETIHVFVCACQSCFYELTLDFRWLNECAIEPSVASGLLLNIHSELVGLQVVTLTDGTISTMGLRHQIRLY